MKKDERKRAVELRKEGRSYNQISKILEVSKSTLCSWFGKDNWSRKITEKNRQKLKGKEQLEKMNTARTKKLGEYYDSAKKEALNLFIRHKDEPLFVSGLMLYAGEGDKSMVSGILRLSNIDPEIIKIFKLFIDQYFKDRKDKVRFWVLAYPDLDLNFCEKFWSGVLGLSKGQFYKTQVIQGRHKQKRLIYGVGNIIINEKYLKVLIIELIRLLSEDLIKSNMRM